MRTQDLSRLEALLAPVSGRVDLSNPLGKILTFALCHRGRIAQEMKDLSGSDSARKWTLDLTTGALFGLLSYWGERFDSLDVYCDRSKPLEVDQPVFNVMIGRQERIYQRLGTRKFALTFNLARPIRLLTRIPPRESKLPTFSQVFLRQL